MRNLPLKQKPEKLKPDLSYLADKWPSNLVARTEVSKFTGGVCEPRSMANLDSLGKGPEGRIRIGRKIAYPVNLFIRWLQARARVIRT